MILGVDIGASKWVAVNIPSGQVPHFADPGAVGDDPERVLAEISSWIRSLPRSRPVGLGLSFAGAVADGVVVGWPNRPSWTGFPILAALRHLAPRVVIEDDGLCAAVGEKTRGSARRLSNFLCISLGTGIGTGIYLDGRPHPSPVGLAHMRVAQRPLCKCGRRGCLQAVYQRAVGAGALAPDSEAGRLLAKCILGMVGLMEFEAVIFAGGLVEHQPDCVHALCEDLAMDLTGTGCRVQTSGNPSHSAALGAYALVHEGMTACAPQ